MKTNRGLSGFLLSGLAAGAAFGYVRHQRRKRMNGEDPFFGRLALIMGGSRGLGFLLAREFAREGARVAIAARDPSELERAVNALRTEGGEVTVRACDVTDRSRVEELIRELEREEGPIDVLVNNAGVITVGPVETMTVEDYESSLAVMFWGMVYATLAVLPHMVRRQRGRIVNVTSIGGRVSVPHLNSYCAAKFAAQGFSEGLRAELGRYGVRVTSVLPGIMRTGGHVNAQFKGQHEDEYRWFAGASSLPGVALDAEKAARRIVRAVRRGDADYVVGVPAKLLAFLHGVAPGLTADASGALGRALLPHSMPAQQTLLGKQLERRKHSLIWKALTTLGRESVSRFQEHRGVGANGAALP